MNDTSLPENQGGCPDAEKHAALFAELVMQQANLALTMMGRVPNPQTGEKTRDLEAARFFIDQLEMLEAKTRGNLSREESRLLQQSLMSVRMAFVEAVEAPAQPATEPSGSGQTGAPAGRTEAAAAKPTESEQPHKRFTKSYGR